MRAGTVLKPVIMKIFVLTAKPSKKVGAKEGKTGDDEEDDG